MPSSATRMSRWHILRNLIELGVIKEYPKNLSEKKYEEIEEKMKKLSKDLDIPMDILDHVFWAKETGEVFKKHTILN